MGQPEKKRMEPGKTEELIFHPSSREEASSSSAAATILFFCAKYIFGCEILTIKRMHFYGRSTEKKPPKLEQENVISFWLELTLHQSFTQLRFLEKVIFFKDARILKKISWQKVNEKSSKAAEKVFDLAAKTASMEQKKKLEHFLKMQVLDLWRVHSSKTSRFMMSLEKNTTPKNHLRRREKHHQMKNG